jgi:hypothetical protein
MNGSVFTFHHRALKYCKCKQLTRKTSDRFRPCPRNVQRASLLGRLLLAPFSSPFRGHGIETYASYRPTATSSSSCTCASRSESVGAIPETRPLCVLSFPNSLFPMLFVLLQFDQG